MNGLPYYPRYPRDLIEGTIGLPFEVKAAYGLVLDLIYMQGGNLPDDPRYISGLLSVSVRKWNSLRQALIDANKIQVSGQFLTNYRAVIELEKLSKYQDKQRENRSRPNKNKDLKKPTLNHTEPEPEPELYLDTSNEVSVILQAIEDYNSFALEVGWPRCQKASPTRSSKLKKRLKDCGGIDGWNAALTKASESDFLCNRTSANFTASIDFLLQESSFTKLMEGNYDNRDSKAKQTNSQQRREAAFDEARERALRIGAARPAQSDIGF